MIPCVTWKVQVSYQERSTCVVCVTAGVWVIWYMGWCFDNYHCTMSSDIEYLHFLSTIAEQWT